MHIYRYFQSITEWFLLEILPNVNLPSWNCSYLEKQFNYRNQPSLCSSLWIQRMIKGVKVLGSERAAPIHLGLEFFWSYPLSILTLELGMEYFFSLSSPAVGWQMLQGLGVINAAQTFFIDESILSFRKSTFSLFLLLECFFCPDSPLPVQLRFAVCPQAFVT